MFLVQHHYADKDLFVGLETRAQAVALIKQIAKEDGLAESLAEDSYANESGDVFVEIHELPLIFRGIKFLPNSY